MDANILDSLPEQTTQYIESRLRLAEVALQRSVRQKESNRRRQSEWYERNAEKKREYAKEYYLRKKNANKPTEATTTPA